MTDIGMEADSGALERCIGISRTEFADNYWSSRPLLSRGVPGGRAFADLLDPAGIDELLSRRGLRTPFLRMAKDGSVLPPRRFTRAGGIGATIADQVADDRVLAELAGGATVVLQGLHRSWGPLIEFAAELTDDLGHPVQINAYLTPRDNQGFSAHFDTHDVFVLQLVGTKHWTVHEPVVGEPSPEQDSDRFRPQIAARAAQLPTLDTVLQPGDALYLPRGFIHAAQAQGERSVHLTVGIHPITRQHLLQRLLTTLTGEPELRRALPLGRDVTDPDVLGPLLSETVAVLQARLASLGEGDLAAVAEGLSDDLIRDTRPAPLSPLNQVALIDGLTATTVLVRRLGLRTRVVPSDHGIVIRFLGTRLELPTAPHRAVTVALSGKPFAVAELPELDPDQQLELARQLLREGILVAPATRDCDR